MLVPRHTLDITMKYSYVPQTEAPYKLDRSSPEIDWNVSEPEKVSFITWLLHKIEIFKCYIALLHFIEYPLKERFY